MNARSFKTEGHCVPETDYMVDIGGWVEAAKKMVDGGKYFMIGRPRQYGRTTLLSALRRRLSGEYMCAFISFEGLEGENFENPALFCRALLKEISNELRRSPMLYGASYAAAWGDADTKVTSFSLLSEHVTKMCQGKKVALLIDEVDKISGNRVFAQFMAMLRNKFLRRIDGRDNTFHSVVLAGAHDMRGLEAKLAKSRAHAPSGGGGRAYAPPWNIASPFTLDMSFSASGIAGMLREYEADHGTGMDIGGVSETIREYTGGHPFLVSRLCQMLDEGGGEIGGWSPGGVRNAVSLLINERNTLFDGISENLEAYPELYSFIHDILVLGRRRGYTLTVPVVEWADMSGFIKCCDGSAVVSNQIFEMVLSNYFISKAESEGARFQEAAH